MLIKNERYGKIGMVIMMARSAREKSESNIYHVMLRGIDRQVIFPEDEDDMRLKLHAVSGNTLLYD